MQPFRFKLVYQIGCADKLVTCVGSPNLRKFFLYLL